MAAVRPHGGGVSWEEYVAEFVGRTDVWAGRTLLEAAGAALDDGLVDEVRMAKHRYFRERAPERLRIASPTIDAIRQILRRVSIAVVSSSPTIDVEPTLRRAELDAALTAMVCGDNVRRHKPDPEPYALALERTRASGAAELEPQQCLVFEDSASGVASAEAAGMRVVRVDAPGNLPALIETATSFTVSKVR